MGASRPSKVQASHVRFLTNWHLNSSTRNLHLISGLMAHKIAFIVTELGIDADSFTLHMWAALAERERD